LARASNILSWESSAHRRVVQASCTRILLLLEQVLAQQLHRCLVTANVRAKSASLTRWITLFRSLQYHCKYRLLLSYRQLIVMLLQ